MVVCSLYFLLVALLNVKGLSRDIVILWKLIVSEKYREKFREVQSPKYFSDEHIYR